MYMLQLYGSLVGMFELNNLNLAVPAPVGRYKALLTEPPEVAGFSAAAAAAALHDVTPLLEALGEEADGPAEVRRQRASWAGRGIRDCCAGVVDCWCFVDGCRVSYVRVWATCQYGRQA